MHVEIVKTDFLTLDGKVNSFTLTPKRNINGMQKVRIDRVVDFERRREDKDRVLGGNIIYNLRDCNLETTQTPPNNKYHYVPEENYFSFEYNHMNIPLGPIGAGYAGRWNLILPPGWRLTELYISDPYHKAEKVEEKKQFAYSVHWDTTSQTQLVEMELHSRRGSFSFIVKGKAYNTKNSQNENSQNFIGSHEANSGITELNSLKLGFPQKNILKILYNSLELKPSFYGVSYDIKTTLEDLFSNKRRG